MDHETLRKEAAELKELILNGEVSIPSFWGCVWPGLVIMAWIVICPFITFQMYIDISRDELEAIGAGLFVGGMFTFMIFNIRSLYLAVPKKFRVNSLFLNMLRKKAVVYYSIFFLVVAVASYLSTYTNWKVIIYLPGLGIPFLFIMIIASADLGRYRMTAFASVLELLKSRKQGGE
jgi:hypothetical protein